MSYPYQGNPGYPQGGGYGQPPAGGGYPGQGPPQPGGFPQPGGGGYPQQGFGPGVGGFGGQPGYGNVSMPTPESASAAAYGGGGNMGYPSQPGFGGSQGYGFTPGAPPPGGPSPSGPGYGMPQGGMPQGGMPQGGMPQGYGAPPAGYGGPPPPSVAMPANPPPQQPYQSSAAPAYGGPTGPTGYPGGNQGYNQPATTSYGGYGASAPAPSQAHAPGPTSSSSAPSYGSYGQPSGAPSMSAQSSFKIKSEGTVKPYPNFNAESDAQVLRKAMKGLGTDEKAIIDILAFRTNEQRQQIKVMFKTCFGRDLISDLKSELGGKFEDVILAMMTKSAEYDASELKRAMRGLGTDEDAMIEILCTRSNSQIEEINKVYKQLYKTTLEKDIVGDTSGHFKRLMISMSAGGRQENQPVNMTKAQEDAQRLYQAGAKRLGTDESAFNSIMASQSYEQLKAVFESYKKIAGHDIEHAIKSEMSGNLELGMLAIIKCVNNRPGYFAEKLYKSMKGLGTDDQTLIRVVVTRSEVDMVQIKQEFQKIYGKSLDQFIRDDTSGDYRKVLLALVSQGGY